MAVSEQTNIPFSPSANGRDKISDEEDDDPFPRMIIDVQDEEEQASVVPGIEVSGTATDTPPTIATKSKRKRTIKPPKGVEKEEPNSAKIRAVRATRRRRERSTAAIAKIRVLVPGIGPRTEHTRVIESLLVYLRFFGQAIDKSDLKVFHCFFSNKSELESKSTSANHSIIEDNGTKLSDDTDQKISF